MARKRNPKTGHLMIEGVSATVSERTGRVTYRARYTYGRGPGRRFSSRNFADYDAAVEWLYAQRIDVRRGTNLDVSTMTVGDYYELWYARRLRDWTPARARIVASVWRNHIKPAIGHVRIQRVSRPMMQAIVDKLERAQLAPRTVETHMATPKALFRAAVVDGIIPTNPATDLVYTRRKAGDRSIWTPLQMQAFLRAVRRDRDAPLWSFLIATGCRAGEALALEWTDIDLDRGLVHIHRTLSMGMDGRYYSRDGTKTNEHGRVVPIDPWMVEVLRDQRAITAGPVVFPNSDGHHRGPQSVRTRFRRLATQAGLPEIRLHDIRHSVASAMVSDGVSIKVVQDVLGHASISTTLNTYAHLDTAGKRQGIGAISRMLGVAHDNNSAKMGAHRVSVSEIVSGPMADR